MRCHSASLNLHQPFLFDHTSAGFPHAGAGYEQLCKRIGEVIADFKTAADL